MLKDLLSPQRPAPHLPAAWFGAWAAALMQPSVATYRRLAAQPSARASRAYIWIFSSSLIGSLIVSLPGLLAQPLDTWLLLSLPIPGVVAVVYWALLAGCAHGVVRLLKGAGTYRQLVYTFALFSAPLTIVASALSLIPWADILLVGLYAYWLILYVVAVGAVGQCSKARALAIALIAFLLIGCATLGAALLIGHMGLPGPADSVLPTE